MKTEEIIKNGYEVMDIVLKKICPELSGTDDDRCGRCEYFGVHDDSCALLDAIFMYQNIVDAPLPAYDALHKAEGR